MMNKNALPGKTALSGERTRLACLFWRLAKTVFDLHLKLHAGKASSSARDDARPPLRSVTSTSAHFRLVIA